MGGPVPKDTLVRRQRITRLWSIEMDEELHLNIGPINLVMLSRTKADSPRETIPFSRFILSSTRHLEHLYLTLPLNGTQLITCYHIIYHVPSSGSGLPQHYFS